MAQEKQSRAFLEMDIVALKNMLANEEKHSATIEAQNRDLLEALKECEEYFDQRADADHNGERYVGNAEMKMLTVVRDAIARAGGR